MLSLRSSGLCAVAVVCFVGLNWADKTAPLAAEMTARDVTKALFKASPDQPLDLSGRDLSKLDLGGLDFKRANLEGANLYGADLSAASLSGARLTGARLDRATITATNFTGADLTRATMLRPNIFSTMEVDVRELPNFESAKLVDANISGRLDQMNFRGADLTDAIFGPRNPGNETLITPRVEMNGCDFTGAILRRADLSLNSLQYAKFINADLTGANLKDTNLAAANFTGADVTDADFTGAVVDGARFEGARGLDRAKGLKRGTADLRP